jgi:hypothetical protein
MMTVDVLDRSREVTMRMIRILAATVLAVAAGTAAAATPATAAAEPVGVLGIMITPLPGGTPSAPRVATLICEPNGGTHPRADEACKDIAEAKGDIAAVPPYPRVGCLPVWQPVTITVRGTWGDKVIDYSAQQGSVSCASISHGSIFMI